MLLKEVSTKRERKQFLLVAKEVYKNDKNWVRPLNKEIDSIFNPDTNVFFGHGKAKRWILFDRQKNMLGRIAAFIDYKTSEKQDQPTGGMGFFECIDNKEAAFLLFDTARDWLKEEGMEAMDGPINFGERDKYWGLLVGGFTHPAYEIAYNHPYYQKLYEDYGFKTYYKAEGFHMDLNKPLPDRFRKIAEWIIKKPEYEFKHIEWSKVDQFVDDFVDVYNEAWASFQENFKPMKAPYVKKTIKKMKMILEPEFIWLAYNKGKPIAIYLMWPDVNMILKHLDGKLSLPAKIKFLYLKKKKTITRARGVLMGVIPKFQNLGVDSGLALNVYNSMKSMPHYKEIEFSWVGDFNPKMRKMWLHIGGEPVKNYITYRYLFDRNKKYKRYPIPED